MKHTKPAVVFLSSGLNFPGGTERAIVNTANLLQQQGHNVRLLVFDKTDDSFFPIHKDIAVWKADLHFGVIETSNVLTRKMTFVRHVLQLKKMLQTIAAPVIISTDYVFTIAARLALKKNDFKIYSWEHHHFYGLKKNRFWSFLFNNVYPKINGVICLNSREAALYESIGCNTITIPNFIQRAPQQAQLFQNSILTIGRLSKAKGSDLIPEIAEAVFKKFPDWSWKIIGEGEEHEVLKKLICERKGESQIEIIKPTTPDISNDYLNASIYVMLSRYECFPMVLLEAMSFGVPCISFDCPTGPAHIIQNGIDGILVEPENKSAMIEAISRLIEAEEDRKRMGTAAYENIARFAPERLYALWKQLLNSE